MKKSDCKPGKEVYYFPLNIRPERLRINRVTYDGIEMKDSVVLYEPDELYETPQELRAAVMAYIKNVEKILAEL